MFVSLVFLFWLHVPIAISGLGPRRPATVVLDEIAITLQAECPCDVNARPGLWFTQTNWILMRSLTRERSPGGIPTQPSLPYNVVPKLRLMGKIL